MMGKIPILILTGPTAVGKTKLSIELAKRMDAEIISCDSSQIYRYMDIGSAKVTKEEMEGIVHHLIDVVDPDEDFSVSDFKERATICIRDIHSRGKKVIVTGGTGLYINSLVYDMDFGKSDSDEKLRAELTNLLENNGKEFMHDILKELDPEAAKRIHPNNAVRVIRAIEVCKLGGKMGDFSKDLKKNEEFDPTIVVLNRDRQVLYDRINLRVDIMFDNGLLKEVQSLMDKGYTKEMTSMKAIGYKEVIDYFDGVYSLEEAREKIQHGSRRYAKRQITWFKRYEDALWIDLDTVVDLDDQIKQIEGKYEC